MWQNLKKFIIKLQGSDEATKKKWLIGASAATMILVIIIWLAYLNHTPEETNAVENEIDNSTNFWKVFKTGLVVVGDSIKDNVRHLIYSIKDTIKSKNTIIIER